MNTLKNNYKIIINIRKKRCIIRGDTNGVPKAEIPEEVRFELRPDAQRDRKEECLSHGRWQGLGPQV